MAMRWLFGKRQQVVDTPEDVPPQALPPQAAYLLWAEDYPPRPHNRLMEVEHDAVLSLLPVVRGLTVLDAGCGTGRYLRELMDRGARPIGLDLSAAMLGRALRITRKVTRGDVRALPFDAMSIDVIVCGLALGDVAELELSLAEMARVLRPGGAIVYSVVHPSGGDLGWSRTFWSRDQQFAIDSHWHSIDRHRAACAAAGLSIEEWREPALDGSSAPVALVVRATR